jgi:DNA-binding GntR family transcriptional regulator
VVARSEEAAGSRGGLTPVGRETLQERACAELRRSLIHGVFDSGEVLRMDLAESLRASTLPVRESLARLEAHESEERRVGNG